MATPPLEIEISSGPAPIRVPLILSPHSGPRVIQMQVAETILKDNSPAENGQPVHQVCNSSRVE